MIDRAGRVRRAGRASVAILGEIGYCRTARVLGSAPLIWLVELGYLLVSRNRSFFNHLLFRGEMDKSA